MKPKRYCPICGKSLVRLIMGHQTPPDWFCQETVTYEYRNFMKEFYHYREENEQNLITAHIPPYRIINNITENCSVLSKFVDPTDPKATPSYKDGTRSFKKVLRTGLLKIDTPENMIKRMKNFVIFS